MSGIVGDNFDKESGLIKSGVGIQKVASDPGSPADGEIWYNTTSGDLKINDEDAEGVIWSVKKVAAKPLAPLAVVDVNVADCT